MTPAGRGKLYQIELPKRVARQLDKIPSRDYPSISKAIQSLKEIPRPAGCKKLLESFYRIRVGDYRVIYWIDDSNKTIVITKAERRRERTYKHIT
jgi:mRNA interferase RelE/StbE